MAYECPVCDALVPDGEHLAHHLAIVALTRGGDHEAWLDERIDGWQEREPEELAADATEHAAEVEHDLVDDPRASGADHAHGSHSHGAASPGGERPSGVTDDARTHSPLGAASDSGSVDAETAEILQEARELTAAMQSEDDDRDADGGADEEGDDPADRTDDAAGRIDDAADRTATDDAADETDTDE